MEVLKIPWEDWKFVRQLGKGSYGTVYEIERTLGSHTEKAAMKVIPIPPSKQIIDDAYSEGYDYESVLTICKSFYDDTLNEYKLMQSLRGYNNIVACEDIASLPMKDSIGWEVYIRMELLTPLLNYHFSSELDEKEIIKLGKDICQALIVCENNNIVHRDVKPGNIFVDKNGNYKLGDFGVARILDHSTNATRVGTERFMAPEVINRKPYDKSVDIYSLGLVMYWLLNGRRMPFLKPGKVPTASEQEKAYYRRISGENLWLPQYGSLPLRKAVLKACDYDRNARYQSAQEMLHALNELESHAYVKNENSASHQEAFFSDEDKTSGNAWDYTNATIGADFSKTSNNKSGQRSSFYEDKTVGPDWTVSKSQNDSYKGAPNDKESQQFVDSFIETMNEKTDDSSKKTNNKSKTKLITKYSSIIVLTILSINYIYIHSDLYNPDSKDDSETITTTYSQTEETISIPDSILKQGSDGKWGMYYDDGTLNQLFSGFAQNKDTGDWFFIENGYVNWDYTGCAKNEEMNCWFMIEDGRVNFDITGDYVFEDGAEVYIENGRIIEGTFQEESGKMVHIKNGVEVTG